MMPLRSPRDVDVGRRGWGQIWDAHEQLLGFYEASTDGLLCKVPVVLASGGALGEHEVVCLQAPADGLLGTARMQVHRQRYETRLPSCRCLGGLGTDLPILRHLCGREDDMLEILPSHGGGSLIAARIWRRWVSLSAPAKGELCRS
jgi:hypothetical protein